MKKWQTETCSSRPFDLQRISDGLFIQRRNIHEVFHEAIDGMNAYTDWECESREITEDEYNMLEEQDEMNALLLLNQMDLAEQQTQLDEAVSLILLGEE